MEQKRVKKEGRGSHQNLGHPGGHYQEKGQKDLHPEGIKSQKKFRETNHQISVIHKEGNQRGYQAKIPGNQPEAIDSDHW